MAGGGESRPPAAPRRGTGLSWLLVIAAVAAAAVAGSAWELGGGAGWLLIALTSLRHLLEAVCGVYAACFVYAAVRYLRRRRVERPDERTPASYPPAAVLYLCCGDEDEAALLSLSRLRYGGPLVHLLHDDATDPEARRRVDRLVGRLEARTGVRWRVLRRPEKSGGKPAAIQYVLGRTAHEYELFLLADNDSHADDPAILDRAVAGFDDPDVAVVQFRNRARVGTEDGVFAATVARAIDVFDVFMTGLFDVLWRPFVGHNAVLRTRHVLEAGGMRPGVFADDIDLTVRMNLRGRRVVYRRDLTMSECHPPNYRSFCVRTGKWAQGCAQVLRMHAAAVAASPAMTRRQKLGFMLFGGFYVAQVAMLAYVALVFLVLPLLTGPTWSATAWALVVGTAVPLTIFLPVAAYLRSEGRDLPFAGTIAACVVTYGSTDLWTILGLARGCRRRAGRWVPTNSVAGDARPGVDWGHFALGSALLVVPYLWAPALLLFPATWLFAAKYLFVPAVAVHYAPAPARSEPVTAPASAGWLRASAMWLLAALLTVILGLAADPARGDDGAAGPEPRVEVDGATLRVDGEPLLVRGIHYSPWRPGEGPGRGFSYPSDAQIAADFEMIRQANANTILVYDPPPRLLDVAGAYGLEVVCVFNVQWWRLAEGQADEIGRELAQRVEERLGKPAVIAWMLGNEIPGWVVDDVGADGVRAALGAWREAVRAVDPHRPVCHGNWPLLRTLDLDRDMDLLCYNVYPFYPTEVIAAGYGNFIEEEIMPLAAGRPVIVTEFGVNTIEVKPQRQADVLATCWRQLLAAGCAGGVVFEFADEWWKNYDNPIQPPDWWRRTEAPDDHLTADRDPEEHYGIVTAEREEKPAYAAVRRMFAETPAAARAAVSWSRRVALWAAGGLVVGLLAAALWLRLTGAPRPASGEQQS